MRLLCLIPLPLPTLVRILFNDYCSRVCVRKTLSEVGWGGGLWVVRYDFNVNTFQRVKRSNV